MTPRAFLASLTALLSFALATVVRVLPLATALILAVIAVCAGLGLLLSRRPA